MPRKAIIGFVSLLMALPIGAISQSAAPVFEFENHDATLGGAAPLSTDVRMGRPANAITIPSTVEIQFYQGRAGWQGPSYFLQAYSDSTYATAVGDPIYPSNFTDPLGNPISLPGYQGIVNASVTATFSTDLYYSLHFGCCDFSDDVRILGASSNAFTCTQVGGNGWCYGGVYSGPPYLLAATDVTNLTALAQYEADGKTQIADGGASLSGTVVVAAALRSNDGSPLQLQVEIEPASSPFTGQPSKTSAAVGSNGTATVSITGLANGQYHWQARAIDAHGGQSLWLSLSMNSATTDFVIPAPQSYSYFLGNAGPATSSVQQFRGYGSGSYAIPVGQWQGSTSLSAWYIGASFYCYNSAIQGLAVVQGTDANMDNATTIYNDTTLSDGGGFLYFYAPLSLVKGDFYQVVEECLWDGSWLGFVNAFNSGGSAVGGIASDSATLTNALDNGTLPPPPGAITVNTNLTAAKFTVSGPVTFSGSGTTETFPTAPAGTYTIAYGPVAGYMAPTSPGQTLAPGGTVVFTGVYNPISIAPNPLNFPVTFVGDTSATRYITVTNGSSVQVTMGAIVASPGFVVSGNCTLIKARGNCRLGVTFQPNAAGPITGTLTVNETKPAGVQTVALTGTALFRVAVTPNPIPAFPSTGIGAVSGPQCVTVTNNTTSPLAVTSIGTSSQYAVMNASTKCQRSLAANASCQACVQFAPSTLGFVSGALSITTGLGVQKIGLSGTGISGGIAATPSPLSFPETTVGAKSAVEFVNLTNDTGAIVTMGAVTASLNFLVSSNSCGTSIAAGKSCRVGVTFQPQSAGSLSGVLTVNETQPAGSQSINLSGSGANAVPKINAISPAVGAAGAGGFVIHVSGSNFSPASTVQWNGAARVTAFINAGQLQAQILSSDIGHANTAQVTVSTPAPGGGKSNSESFQILPLSWTKLKGSWSAECDTSFGVLAIPPDNPAGIYIGSSDLTHGCGIFKSTDSGQHWSSINNGLPQIGLLTKNYAAISALAIAPGKTSVLYAGTYVDTGIGVLFGQVLTTSNSGASWKDASGKPTGLLGTVNQINGPVLDIAVDPENSQQVLLTVPGAGIFRTSDGGSDWAVVDPGTNTPSAMSFITALRIAASDPSYAYATGFTGVSLDLPICYGQDCLALQGILPIDPIKSGDSGSDWAFMTSPGANPLPDFICDLAVDPHDPSIVYAATQAYLASGGVITSSGNKGVFRSADGGVTWQPINDDNGANISQFPIVKILIDPDVSTTLYAVTGFNGVFRSTDSGATWQQITMTGLAKSTFVATIGIAKSVLYVLTSDGVYSIDRHCTSNVCVQ
jgi:hypothetical protein